MTPEVMDVLVYFLSSSEGSRVWEITDAAADVGYYENQRTVAGAGWLNRWRPGRDDIYKLPEAPGQSIAIRPGDAFKVYASRHIGAHVLATFSGAPFKPEYERHIDPPSER